MNVNARQAIAMLDQEIRWHVDYAVSNPPATGFSETWCEGFIAGLKQAKLLIETAAEQRRAADVALAQPSE